MRAFRRAFVLPVIIAFGCVMEDATQDSTEQKAAAPVEDAAAVRQAIDAGNARVIAGFKAGDANAAAAQYAPDAVVMLAEAPAMRGQAAIVEGLNGWFSEATITDFTLTTGDVMVAGDLAIETGAYTMTLTPKAGGAAHTDQGKYLTVWKKQPDGSWKLIRDIANTDLPATPH